MGIPEARAGRLGRAADLQGRCLEGGKRESPRETPGPGAWPLRPGAAPQSWEVPGTPTPLQRVGLSRTHTALGPPLPISERPVS